jgi:DNA-binding GntR family transcriptional regulator
MELIDREDHQKLYIQLLQIIKKKIESGEWPLNSQIPTEEELCNTFNVSRATVRTAVLELVRQGYLKRQQGKGTFIYKNVISDGLSMLTNFKELMFEYNLALTTKVMARTVMMPVDDLDARLNISPDKHVIYIKRLYSVDEEPVLLQESYIPYHLCPLLLEDDIEHHSLFDIFEKNYGIKITRVDNHIDIARLTLNESLAIGLTEGAAAILLTQNFYSGDTLIMYSRSVKRPDRFQFFIELERKIA